MKKKKHRNLRLSILKEAKLIKRNDSTISNLRTFYLALKSLESISISLEKHTFCKEEKISCLYSFCRNFIIAAVNGFRTFGVARSEKRKIMQNT